MPKSPAGEDQDTPGRDPLLREFMGHRRLMLTSWTELILGGKQEPASLMAEVESTVTALRDLLRLLAE